MSMHHRFSAVAFLALFLVPACSGEGEQQRASEVAQSGALLQGSAGSVGGGVAQQAVTSSGHDLHGYEPPALETLGGEFSLVDASGAAFTEKEFLGNWSLVYLGYMECQEACPIAMATLPWAAERLREDGLPARAVFIDINAPRLDDATGGLHHAVLQTASGLGDAHSTHAIPATLASKPATGPEIRRRALAVWGKNIDDDMAVLSGTRKQVLAAMRIFQTRAETNMMPSAEASHRINHTTHVYIVDPQAKVVGLLYHYSTLDEMTSAVKKLAESAHTTSH
jgi:protein SCO1/2